MLTGAMLGLMQSVGQDIVTLAGDLDDVEFFSSRITLAETLRKLASMSRNAQYMPFEIKVRTHKIDWASWVALDVALVKPSHHRLQIWVAIRELTPQTLRHLDEYRRKDPYLFSIFP